MKCLEIVFKELIDETPQDILSRSEHSIYHYTNLMVHENSYLVPIGKKEFARIVLEF